MGVSKIHLLQILINIENKNPDNVMRQVIIHAVFLISSIALALYKRILHQKLILKN